MASGVTDQGIKVEQTLHGYSDGHRLLAGSMTLSPRDARTMLVLSDAAGSGLRVGEGGYLTGYPLVESRRYAIAKTWAAPEMPRPGCVWTHTLLLRFDDLASALSPEDILTFFARPGQVDIKRYSTSSTLYHHNIEHGLPALEAAWIERPLSALYEQPDMRVTVKSDPIVDIQSAVIATWLQQWPELRARFRFSTLVTTDRSSRDGIFDLQVVATEGAVRVRIPDSVDAGQWHRSQEWMSPVVSDLVQGRNSELRKFLEAYSTGLPPTRATFGRLAAMHYYFQKASLDSDAVERLIGLAEDGTDEAGPRDPQLVDLVANAIASAKFNWTPRWLEFVSRNCDSPSVLSLARTMGPRIWRENPEVLAEIAARSSGGALWTSEAIGSMTASQIISGLHNAPSLTGLALNAVPSLVGENEFWRLGASFVRAGLAAIEGEADIRRALGSIIETGRVDLAQEVVARFGAEKLLGALSEHAVTRTELYEWIAAAKEDIKGVSRYLNSHPRSSWELVEAISGVLEPDAVLSGPASDPWVNAVGRLPNAKLSQYFLAFLLTRALGDASNDAAGLFRISFEKVHMAAAKSQLSDEAWSLLEPRLPRSMFWFDWDRCQRLRAGLVAAFVERHLPLEGFIDVVEDDQLFAVLSWHANSSEQGHEFLKGVRRRLRNGKLDHGARLSLLDRILG